VPELRGHGLGSALPAGWDGRITVRNDGRPESLQADSGVGAFVAEPFPVLHAANFALPEERGDFGGGAVELMGARDVFVVLFEFGPDATGTPLFAAQGMPRSLRPSDFDETTLRRGIRGQAGYQAFFQESGRAFCLYVVLGAAAARARLVPIVNQVLAGVRIDPAGRA
jgi:hypothetical protein